MFGKCVLRIGEKWDTTVEKSSREVMLVGRMSSGTSMSISKVADSAAEPVGEETSCRRAEASTPVEEAAPSVGRWERLSAPEAIEETETSRRGRVEVRRRERASGEEYPRPHAAHN